MNKIIPREIFKWWKDELVRHLLVEGCIISIKLPHENYTGTMYVIGYGVFYINGNCVNEQTWEEHEKMQLFNKKIEVLINE